MATSAEPPAYEIPLSQQQLAMLGEIVVILGQIDDDMTRSLTGLLGIDRPTANRIMRVQDPIDLWAGVLKGRCDHPHFAAALELAASEVKAVHRDRNDFIHADYQPAFSFQGEWVTVRSPASQGDDWAGTVIASRSRDQKQRKADELATLRSRAARASRLVAHICHAVAPHGSWDQSPWLVSVEPFLARSAGRPPVTPPPAPRSVTFSNVRAVIVDDDKNGAPSASRKPIVPT